MPNALITPVESFARLPLHWQSAESLTRKIGTDWLAGLRGVALSVPLAIVPEERDVILNPKHPAFGR